MLIDFAFVLVVCLAIFQGMKKGFIRAVISFFSYLIALILAVQFSSLLAESLPKHEGSLQKWIPLLCFLAIFLTVIFLGGLVAKMLEKTTEIMMLGWLNRLGGIIFYLITYTMLFSALLFFGTRMKWFESNQMNKSVFFDFISSFAPVIFDFLGNIIPPLKNSFNKLEQFFSPYKG